MALEKPQTDVSDRISALPNEDVEKQTLSHFVNQDREKAQEFFRSFDKTAFVESVDRAFQKCRNVFQAICSVIFKMKSIEVAPSMVAEDELTDIIHNITSQNDDGLKIGPDDLGVVTTRSFKKGEYICEYIGTLFEKLDAPPFQQNENMMSFTVTWQGQRQDYCIDASKETTGMGRLIKRQNFEFNVVPKSILLNGKIRVYFVADKDIPIGEELLCPLSSSACSSVTFLSDKPLQQ